MIKTEVRAKYSHQYSKYVNTNESIYICDYTNITKSLPNKRGVEFFVTNPPLDNEYFIIDNSIGMNIGGIPFDNDSFRFPNTVRSQCECVVFPHDSTDESWILFTELKYRVKNNRFNRDQILKAINQLYRTRYYYVQNQIISKKNRTYLIVSFPKQNIPFKGFTPTPAQLTKLKRNKNIILSFTNSIIVIDGKSLYVA